MVTDVFREARMKEGQATYAPTDHVDFVHLQRVLIASISLMKRTRRELLRANRNARRHEVEVVRVAPTLRTRLRSQSSAA